MENSRDEFDEIFMGVPGSQVPIHIFVQLHMYKYVCICVCVYFSYVDL